MNNVILDVRERDEFDAEHVEHSINVPLSEFHRVAPGVLKNLSDKEIIIMCRSGNRARLALEQIPAVTNNSAIPAKVFEGGIIEWKKQGKPTNVFKKGHLPIMRQVQLTAGALVFVFAVLALIVSPLFALGAAFVGAGLTFAGATGICALAIVMSKMPWNKTAPKQELCDVSPNSKSCVS